MFPFTHPGARVSVAPDGTVYAIPDPPALEAAYRQLAQRAETCRQQGRQVVVVQGLGFVGAAVAATLAGTVDAAGRLLYFVVGVDLPSPSAYWKVARLNEGASPITSPDPELGALIHKSVQVHQNLCATVCEQAYALADVIVVNIQLDVTDRTEFTAAKLDLDLDRFRAGLRTIGRFMRPEALVLIETTVPIGTCTQVAAPTLNEERARRGITQSLHLGHAYERVTPGPRYIASIRRFWRSFAGIDEASAHKVREFLSSFIDTKSYPLWQLEDTNASELGKLLENSYRAMNIAFIHEWSLLAEQLGINLFEVIDSIRVRKGTHDNMRFPGFGVGGYCLTKDSLIAQWSATHLAHANVELSMTLNALRVNYSMPLHTLDLLRELAGGSLEGKTIAVCGICYLPEVADTRNSPAELLVDRLKSEGARVMVHDPCIESWPERPGVALAQDLPRCLAEADGAVFTVAHRAYTRLASAVPGVGRCTPLFVVDANNVISDQDARTLHEAGWRLLGVGKGHWRRRQYQCP